MLENEKPMYSPAMYNKSCEIQPYNRDAARREVICCLPGLIEMDMLTMHALFQTMWREQTVERPSIHSIFNH